MNIVCINNKPNGTSYIMENVPLTIGKIYISQKINFKTSPNCVIVLDDKGSFKEYKEDRFVTEPEWIELNRDNKLKELGI